MRLNRRVRRHEQQDRIKTRFGRVTEKHFGMDACEARASDLIAVDRIVRLMSLRPEEITPQLDENSILTGVAAPGGGPDLLPILAPGRLWADE